GGLFATKDRAATAGAAKMKASPNGEALWDKAPGGDLLQPAICARRSNARPRKTPTVSGGGSWNKAFGVDLLRFASCGRHSNGAKKKPPPLRVEVFGIKPLAVTYSCMAKPHYHRRMRVSLLSSGWDQVGPRRYGRQGRGGSSALAPAPHLLEPSDR